MEVDVGDKWTPDGRSGYTLYERLRLMVVKGSLRRAKERKPRSQEISFSWSRKWDLSVLDISTWVKQWWW